MSDEKKFAAQDAIFDAVAKLVADVDKKFDNPQVKAKSLRDLAFAYRLAAGGAQPGSLGE